MVGAPRIEPPGVIWYRRDVVSAPVPAPTPASAWAPLRLHPMFRALWIAQFASNVGTWMQTVGAQWLLIDRSPLLVSLVQTASSLPIVVLALPAGAWADVVDRRRLLLGAQGAMFVAAAVLAAVTFLGMTSPALILGLTFALGCGNAIAAPAWQAIQPDLVERTLLPQAAALNGLNMNLARAVGPAIGGFVVAAVGAGWVFALNAVSFVGIVVVVACWRAPARGGDGPARAAGRGAARRRALRAPRADRAPPAVPGGAVHPGGLGGVGAAAGGRGDTGWASGRAGTACCWAWSASAPSPARWSSRGCGRAVGSARLVTGAMVVTAVALAVVATVGDAVVVGHRAAARRRRRGSR